MIKLVHSQAGRILGEYVLEEGRVCIGRNESNDIRINDLTVSGCHVVIEISPSLYLEGLNDIYIIDQNSTNGTIINGKNIKKCLFKHGDIAAIGQHEICLIDEEAQGFEQTMIYIPDD